MKKGKLKVTPFDVDGPFLRARERLLNFGESMTFSSMVQATIAEVCKCEEEYELAIFMDDLELAAKKKRTIEALNRSLVFASNLLEEENGISA